MFFPSPRRSLALAALFAALLCAPGLPPSGLAAGKKKRDPGIEIRFHAQTNGYDPTFAAKVRLGNPPQEMIVEKIPLITEHDFLSFYPYRAADGSFSAVFKLDRHGSATLEELSADKRGQSLLVVVNGQPLMSMVIDRTIKDGIIFIPGGLSEANIRALGASFTVMNLPGGVPAGTGPANRRQPTAGRPADTSDLPSVSQ